MNQRDIEDAAAGGLGLPLLPCEDDFLPNRQRFNFGEGAKGAVSCNVSHR